jgi:hypothetical protein
MVINNIILAFCEDIKLYAVGLIVTGKFNFRFHKKIRKQSDHEI